MASVGNSLAICGIMRVTSCCAGVKTWPRSSGWIGSRFASWRWFRRGSTFPGKLGLVNGQRSTVVRLLIVYGLWLIIYCWWFLVNGLWLLIYGWGFAVDFYMLMVYGWLSWAHGLWLIGIGWWFMVVGLCWWLKLIGIGWCFVCGLMVCGWLFLVWWFLVDYLRLMVYG